MSENEGLNDHHYTELGCTNCQQYVKVKIEKTATGNLTIKCPECGHNHYRYCKNGIITEDRWRSSAQMISRSAFTYTTTGTSATAGVTDAATSFIRMSWANGTDTGSTW